MKVWGIETKQETDHGAYYEGDCYSMFVFEATARFWCDALNYGYHVQWRKTAAHDAARHASDAQEYDALASAGLREPRTWEPYVQRVEVPAYINQYAVEEYEVNEDSVPAVEVVS